MLEGDTLVASLDRYADVERRTTDIIASLPDLDGTTPCPRRRGTCLAPADQPPRSIAPDRGDRPAPGHADIIREALDGAKTMG